MEETRLKLRTTEMQNEVSMTKLLTPITKNDAYYDHKRQRFDDMLIRSYKYTQN